MELSDDLDIAASPLGRLSAVRPRSTYRARDVFVTESAPVFALAGPFHPNVELTPHAHEFVEIIVVASGRGTHLGAQGTVELRPGTVVVVRPGAWHAFDDLHDVEVAMICISPAALGSDLAFLRARPSTRDLLYAGPLSGTARGTWVTEIPMPVAKEVVRETRRLSKRMKDHPDDVLSLVGHLILVLGTIASGMSASGDREPNHPAVAAVLRRLEAAPERQWALTELARSVSLDAAYLCRLFRADVGVAPITYLARIRAEKAANLLTVTRAPVSQIGAQVGWPDPTYFARRFQSLIGMSPTQYRRRMQTETTQTWMAQT